MKLWMNFCFSFKNLNSVVYMRVVFPAPEGHVMIVNVHNLIWTSISWRLYFDAFFIFTIELLGVCSNAAVTFFLPRIYWAVKVSDFKNSSYGPLNITFPPKSPAHGPISTTRSDALINSSLCSTTMIVFPISLNFFIATIALLISLISSPIVGSSST